MNSQPTSDPQPTQTLPGSHSVSATCPKHGAYQARVIPVPNLPDYPPIQLGCPECETERRVDAAQQAEREKVARRKAELDSRLGGIGLPERFAACSFANYETRLDGQRHALAVVKAMASSPRKGDSLILCGKCGTGKTHLGAAVARHFAETGRTAKFLSVLDAVRHVRETYRPGSERTERQALSDLIGVDLLVLDEIAVQAGTDHEKMVLSEIVNGRYQACRSTILISNLTREELAIYLGDRIMDRFRETGGIVAFDWGSYRGAPA